MFVAGGASPLPEALAHGEADVMDFRDVASFLAFLVLAPLFIAVFVVAFAIMAPVLVPLWLLDRWRERSERP